ncbi:MAG TPA: phosphodiesterase, partial [Myxococcota bacterium]|nr:phosphodiesterase [Myxococcota bacterium]
EARIIAVSDVFQALRQDRPYRAGMSIERALGLVDEMSLAGKLDPDVVGLLHSNIDACDHAARAQA